MQTKNDLNHLIKITLSVLSMLIVHQKVSADSGQEVSFSEHFYQDYQTEQWGQEVQNRIDELDRQRSDVRYQIHDLEDRERAESQDLRRIESELRRLEPELRRAQRDLQNVERELKQAQREKGQAEKEVQNLERQKSQLQRSIQSKERQIAQAKRQIASLKREIAQLERQRDPQKIKTLKGRNRDLQQEIADNQESIERLTKKINDMEEKGCSSAHCMIVLKRIKQMRERAVKKDQELKAERRENRREIAKLERAEKAYQQKAAELKREERSLKVNERSLRQEKSQLKQVERQLPSAQRNLAQAKREESRLQNEQRLLQRKEEKIASNYNQQKQNERRVEAELSRVRSRLRQAHERESLLSRQIADLRSRGELERMVLVGNRLSYSLDRDLRDAGVPVSNVERDSMMPRLGSLDTVYVLANSIEAPLSIEVEEALVAHAEQGGLVMVLGNPDALMLDQRSPLKDLMAVEVVGETISYDLDGRDVLRGLNLRERLRGLELEKLHSGLHVEEVLRDGYKTLATTTELRNDGRIMVIALDMEDLGLNSLSSVENALCRNIDYYEKRQRGVCHLEN